MYTETSAKDGTGIKQIKEAAIGLGHELNHRRKLRGMRNRAVRALTLGFPNVAKSALINRFIIEKSALEVSPTVCVAISASIKLFSH